MTPEVATRAGLVPPRRVLAAEPARWPRSTVARLPLAGGAFGLVNAALFSLTATRPSAAGVLAYQNLWVVFVGPMLVALLVATLVHLDRRSMAGGTSCRAVEPVHRRLAAFTVLAAGALLMNGLAVGVPAVVASVLFGAGPSVAELAGVVGVAWLGHLGLIALLLRAGAHLRRMALLAVAFGWTVIGVLLAESPAWVVLPPTWTVRGPLPLIGTHANGTSLEPTAALADASPWAVATLAVLGAAAVLLVPVPRRAGPGCAPVAPVAPIGAEAAAAGVRSPTPAPSPWRSVRGRPRPAAALVIVVARTSLRWLVPAAVAVSGLILRWRDPAGSLEMYALLVLPLGATVLPIVAWGAAAGGARAAATRPPSPGAFALGLAGLGAGVAAAVSVAVCAIHLAAGLPADRAAASVLATVMVGALLSTAALWVVMRAGTAAAVAAGVVGLLLALLVGGTSMQERIWPLVPWAWAAYTDTARLSVTLPVSAVLTVLFAVLVTSTARRITS